MPPAILVLAVLAAPASILAAIASVAALVRLGTLERSNRAGFSDLFSAFGKLQRQVTLARHLTPAPPEAPPPGAAPPLPLGFVEQADEERRRRRELATPPEEPRGPAAVEPAPAPVRDSVADAPEGGPLERPARTKAPDVAAARAAGLPAADAHAVAIAHSGRLPKGMVAIPREEPDDDPDSDGETRVLRASELPREEPPRRPAGFYQAVAPPREEPHKKRDTPTLPSARAPEPPTWSARPK